MRAQIADLNKKIGQEAEIYGWVHVRRDLGNISFIVLRDATAKVQVVLVPGEIDGHSAEVTKKIRAEYVLKIIGKVQKREERQVNFKIFNGELVFPVKYCGEK